MNYARKKWLNKRKWDKRKAVVSDYAVILFQAIFYAIALWILIVGLTI